jgi:hypothetical protein
LLEIGKITVSAPIQAILNDCSGEKQVDRWNFGQLFD